jgi:hypothetical protein
MPSKEYLGNQISADGLHPTEEKNVLDTFIPDYKKFTSVT